MHTCDNSYMEVTRKGPSSRHVVINFKGDAGFIHFGEIDGVKGPFMYSDDGETLRRGRDDKEVTPEEITRDIAR